MPRRLLPALALLALAPGARADDPVVLVPDRDAVAIERDTVLAPGVHLVRERDGAGVLRIRKDGVVLDLGGATLRGAPEDAAPDTLTGVGVLVEDAQGVTIRHGSVAGFRVGIRAVHADGLVVEDVDASGNFRQRLKSTPEKEDASDWLWPHHDDEGEWETRYGAGISLSESVGAIVRRCRVRHGQNGLLLTRCRGGFVYDNDFSFDSGWGIALYRTTHTEISCNRCDFCVRGTSHGVYHRGQDSAAILVFEQSSHNAFVKNSGTHSGDGFFLYAGHETTQRTGKGGSNDNLVFGNDFRFAVANGIEATFSTGNRFEQNDCSGADHGIWAGYSYGCEFRSNRIHDCLTAGISVEHGHDNLYVGNEIRGARYGIHLWWDEDKDVLEGVYGRTQDCTSARNTVRQNTLEGGEAAIRLDGDVDGRLTFNRLPARVTRIQLLGTTRIARMEHDAYAGDLAVENRTGHAVEIHDARGLGGAFRAEGDPVRLLEAPTTTPVRPPPPSGAPAVRGRQDTRLPADLPVGRAEMRIDEWGPIDPRETRLLPARQAAPGPRARVHLLGREAFEVVETGAGVTASPRAGTAPATIVVEAEGEGPVLRPFRIVVATAGKRLVAEGSLVRMPWTVRFFTWAEANDPIAHPDAFERLLAGEPAVERDVDALDWGWQGGGPEGVPPDRFATLATSEVTLPAGTWRLRVVSDDGVRLFVDGKPVLERWDRHGPTEDVAEVTLEAGPHAFRLEHFEIDGWAWLSFRLERVR